MNLNTQLITFTFSFFYGIFFSFSLDIISKFVFKLKKTKQIIATLAFVLINSIVYFLILEQLNYGIIHPYYLIIFIIGFFIYMFIKKVVIVLIKKK